TSALAGPAYAASHRPSALAAATCAIPAGCIRPSRSSRPTISTLRCDHRLRGRRGVNRCRKLVSSRLRACPSIQPKHSASSSASARLSVVGPAASLRASTSHAPDDTAWWRSSHARQAAASLTISSSRSNFWSPAMPASLATGSDRKLRRGRLRRGGTPPRRSRSCRAAGGSLGEQGVDLADRLPQALHHTHLQDLLHLFAG